MGHAPDETRVARKAADQTVNNSTTLVDCTGLKLAVGPNEVWGFLLDLHGISGLTATMDIGWTVPAGTTMKWVEVPGTSVTRIQTDRVNLNISTTARSAHPVGTIIVGSTGGDVQLQFAQDALEAVDTKVLANSYLIAWKLQ